MVRKPRWNHWRNMPRIEVWEGVALSCDLDPKQREDRTFLDDFRQQLRYQPGLSPAAAAALRDKFESRCDVAESNIGARVLKLSAYDGYDALHCSIDFHEFARWAINVVGWTDAPADFNDIAMQEPEMRASVNATPQHESEDALSTKEKNTLLKMIILMAKHGFDYNPDKSRNRAVSDITRFLADDGIPLNDDTVRTWLSEATKVLPKKVSPTLGQVIATAAGKKTKG